MTVVVGVIWPRLPAWKTSSVTVTLGGGMLADPGVRRVRFEAPARSMGGLAVGAAWSTPLECGAEALFVRFAARSCHCYRRDWRA